MSSRFAQKNQDLLGAWCYKSSPAPILLETLVPTKTRRSAANTLLLYSLFFGSTFDRSHPLETRKVSNEIKSPELRSIRLPASKVCILPMISISVDCPCWCIVHIDTCTVCCLLGNGGIYSLILVWPLYIQSWSFWLLFPQV